MTDEEYRREAAADTAAKMGFRPGESTLIELDEGRWRMFSEGGKTYLAVKGTVFYGVGGR